MTTLLENLIGRLWNWTASKRGRPKGTTGLQLGMAMVDDRVSKTRVFIPTAKRAEHLALLGRTGTGKSSLLKYMAAQDIRSRRGFVCFDLHGDTTPYLLALIADEERRSRQDLSKNVIVIDPADPEWAVGLNVLQRTPHRHSFVQVAEVSELLKKQLKGEPLGPQTDELLRNGALSLNESGQSMVEIQLFLTNAVFRAYCLQRTTNQDVRDYFENRFNRASEAMQAVMRDAVLNKVTGFTSDPHFRHILGQTISTFSLIDAIDAGYWVIVNLDKGRLGDHGPTLGSLLLVLLKNALFARRRRDRLFTLYCDEIQNLVAYDSSLDTLLSEARKFGISICSANQFLDQYPPVMRAAILSIGTHVLFQLSSTDADKMAQALDGGKSLVELLKNLPQREMVVKSGHYRSIHARVPRVSFPVSDPSDLYNRSRLRWARRRTDVEQQIRSRQSVFNQGTREVLDDWE